MMSERPYPAWVDITCKLAHVDEDDNQVNPDMQIEYTNDGGNEDPVIQIILLDPHDSFDENEDRKKQGAYLNKEQALFLSKFLKFVVEAF